MPLPATDPVTGGYSERVGQANRVFCTTQQDAATNIVLANVPGLQLNLKAGRKYLLRGKLFLVSTSNGGMKLKFGGTATVTSMIAELKTFTTTTQNASSQITALASNLVAATVATDSGVLEAYLNVLAGGTLTLTMCQNASHADTSSVLVGSYLELTDVT